MKKIALTLAACLFSASAVVAAEPANTIQQTVFKPTKTENQSTLRHNTAGYCNMYGQCFGNICQTPIGWCFQVNYSPIGGSCYCNQWGYGNTRS